MRQNKINKIIALFCVVTFLSTQIQSELPWIPSHLAPTSSIAKRPIPYQGTLALEGYGVELYLQKTGEKSPKKGSGYATAAGLAFLLGLPLSSGLGLLATPTVASAQDAETNTTLIGGIRSKLSELKDKESQAAEAEAKSAILQLSGRTDLELLLPLIEFLNSSSIDYKKHPELYDVLLEQIVSVIEANRNETMTLRIRHGKGRDIYHHRNEQTQDREAVAEITKILITEMLRRAQLRTNNQDNQNDPADDLESRLTAQLFRLYGMLVKKGVITYDVRFVNRMVTDVVAMDESGRGGSSARRMIYGLLQMMADLPVHAEAMTNTLNWTSSLYKVSSNRSRRFWGDRIARSDLAFSYWNKRIQLRGDDLFYLALQRWLKGQLGDRMFEEELALPEEENVARVQPQPGEMPKPEGEKSVESQPEVKKPSIDWGRIMALILVLLVPAIGLVVVGINLWKRKQRNRVLAQFNLQGKADLSRLFSPRVEPFQAPKVSDFNINGIPIQPAYPVTQVRDVQGGFRLSPQGDQRVGVQHSQFPPFYARQLGHFFIKEDTFLQHFQDPQNNPSMTGIDEQNGVIVNLHRVGNILVSGETYGVHNEIPFFRVWDLQGQQEFAFLAIGDYLIYPVPPGKDPYGNNVYQAVRLVRNTQGQVIRAEVTQLLEKGNMLINLNPIQQMQNMNVHEVWDWEAQAMSTIREFEGYYFVSELGRGGMGVVNQAWDPAKPEPVAVKRIIPPTIQPGLSEEAMQEAIDEANELRERFVREFQAMGDLPAHENIVRIHRTGGSVFTAFFEMDMIDGEPLNVILSRLNQHSTLSLLEAIEIAIQTSVGLNHVHQHGMVHRDLKPENLFITRAGKVLVSDFGLVRRADSNTLTKTGIGLGTPIYMSPEQLKPMLDNSKMSVDYRTDIYAIGAILYQLVTGVRPFPGALGAILAMKKDQESHDIIFNLFSEREDLTGLPPGLIDIIRNAMAYDENERYQTYEQFISDLREISQNPSARFKVKSRIRIKKQTKLILSVVLATLSLIGVTWAISYLTRLRYSVDDSIAPVSTRDQPKKEEPVRYFNWEELDQLVQAGKIDEAIQQLDKEISAYPDATETGRSYYYRARLQIEKARRTSDRDAKRELYRRSFQDLDQASQRMSELRSNFGTRFLRIIILGIQDMGTPSEFKEMMREIGEFRKAVQESDLSEELKNEWLRKADESQNRAYYWERIVISLLLGDDPFIREAESDRLIPLTAPMDVAL